MDNVYVARHSNLATYLAYKTGIIPEFRIRDGKFEWIFPNLQVMELFADEYYNIYKNNKESAVDLNLIIGAFNIVMDAKSKYFKERKAIREI